MRERYARSTSVPESGSGPASWGFDIAAQRPPEACGGQGIRGVNQGVNRIVAGREFKRTPADKKPR